MPRLGRRLSPLLSAAALAAALVGPVAGAVGAPPDDPAFDDGLQWGLTQIAAPAAWDRSTGAGVTIAVVDSGVDLEHEDLRTRLEGDVSCIEADGDPGACRRSGQDDSGHGTHVAGIAAADADNGEGIAGVAPDATLLAVRVLADRCKDRSACAPSGSPADVAAGIRWAAGHGADVVNLSLGGTLEDEGRCVVCDAVEDAWAQGVVTVVAAGDDAALPEALARAHAVVVTATTRTGAIASYARTGGAALQAARWLVAAPGGETETAATECAPGGEPEGVLSTHWQPGGTDGYACQAGTSMAAPHVSGSLAVLLAQGRSPQEAVDRLLATARDLGSPGSDAQYGAGLVDLGRATGDGPAAATQGGDAIAPAAGRAEPLRPAPFTPPSATDDGWPRAALLGLAAVLVATGAVLRRRARHALHADERAHDPDQAD